MNGLRVTLQDLSHILSTKSLQHEAYVPSNVLKRRFWSFLRDFSREEKSALEIAKVDSLKATVDRTRTTLPEVVTTSSGRSPAQFFHFEANAKTKCAEALKSFVRRNDLLTLLDENPIPRNAILNLTCYKALQNVPADDFGFAPVDGADKSERGDNVLKIISTPQGNQGAIIERKIERPRTDDLSTRIATGESPAPRNCESLQRDRSPRVASLENRRNLSSPYVAHRVFSSNSCTMVQRFAETIGPSTANSSGMLHAKLSIPLRSARSYSGYVSLTKLRSFSCCGSKKPTDCKDSDQRKTGSQCEAKSEKSLCEGKTPQKKMCGQKSASSCDDIHGKRGKNNDLKTCRSKKTEEICSSKKTDRSCSSKKVDRGCSSKKIDRSCRSKKIDLSCGSEKTGRSCSSKKTVRSCSSKKTDRSCSSKKTDRSSSVKGRDSIKNCTSSQKQNINAQCTSRRPKSSCGRKKDFQKFGKPNVTCTERKKTESRRECDKQRESDAVCGKILRERIRERCSGRKKNCSRSGNKICEKSGNSPGKRRYSQLSFPSNYSRHRVALHAFIPDNVSASDGTRRFFASCDKDKNLESHCGRLKKASEAQKEAEKKCTKGSAAKRLSQKSASDKPQNCSGSSQEEKQPETSKSCTREKYCDSRKGHVEDRPEDRQQPKETRKGGESAKQRIERELKEMSECKEHRGKDETCKSSVVKKESKTCGSEAGETRDKSKKDDTCKSSTSTAKMSVTNEPSFWRGLLGTARDESPIIVRNVSQSDVMFDRSLYTTKAYYQDDATVERAADHGGGMSNVDFIHGDELPLFVEIENNEEEEQAADERIDRSPEHD